MGAVVVVFVAPRYGSRLHYVQYYPWYMSLVVSFQSRWRF